jgi:polyphosphate kinase
MGKDKFKYLNRDLSWLSFNHRVLMEAGDATVPIYSRISFLSIFSSNLDEFFRVRMPSILAFTAIKAKRTSLRSDYPKELVKDVQETVFRQLEEFGRLLTKEIIPELKKNNIILVYGTSIRPEHLEDIRDYFLSRVLSFLQPVILKTENRDSIFLENNALYFIVEISKTEEPEMHEYALVNIPSSNLPRFNQLADIGNERYIIFLDDVLRYNLQELFPGFAIQGAWSIKLTRDAELNLEDEFAGDIAEKIEKQLEKRDIGHATRLLFDKSMPEIIQQFIQQYFTVTDEEMIEGGRYHNLRDLADLPDPAHGKLSYQPWVPLVHRGFDNYRSVFKSILEGEKLFHLPYHSYNYVLRFFNEAAIDPAVTEINITLYRVAANSHIVNALISAAKNGKKVIVFVELKARFDEANNLKWSKKMKAAGIKIINSIPKMKVHAKVALIKRRENNEWQYFSFMGTGNFNETTSRFYTDHVLMTTHPEFGSEAELLFQYLQSRKQPYEYGKIPFKHLLVSKFNMISCFHHLIDREIKNAKLGKPSRIIIKLNNLQEKEMIAKLYQASNAGVPVDLLVRGICCLAPGVKNQSENINVYRIVDRYLEHARIFIFHNDGNPDYYMGSADWMNRNLHSRVEVVFPVYQAKLQQELSDIIQMQLKDNRKAVLLSADLKNNRISDNGDPFEAQSAIYEYVKNRVD